MIEFVATVLLFRVTVVLLLNGQDKGHRIHDLMVCTYPNAPRFANETFNRGIDRGIPLHSERTKAVCLISRRHVL